MTPSSSTSPPHHRTTPRTGSIANQLNHEELAQLHAMRKPVQRNQSKRDSVPLGGRTVIGGLQLDGVNLSTVRLRSCVRAKTKIGLANLTYNMQRMVWLIDQATAACYPRRGSPWLGRARSSSPASPNPYSAAVMKCPGPRNPKLFPPDGLGIRAGGGIPAMGAGGRIELPAMPSCRTRRIKRGARAVPGVTWQ